MSHGDKRVVVEAAADEMGLSERGMERNLEVECFEDDAVFVMLDGSSPCITVSDLPGVINDVSGQNVCGILGGPGKSQMIWGEIGDICKEGNEGGRDVRAWKEEGTWGKDASEGAIGRVVTAGDVSSVYFVHAIGLNEEFMDSPENNVGLIVAMLAIPPSFDNAGVVIMDDDARSCRGDEIKGADEELEANGFGPTDVPLCVKGLSFGVE